MILGHLAISALLHRYAKAEWTPVMAAAVFPDAVDKTLCQLLHLTPTGRMWGHTLLSLAISTALVGHTWGRWAARSWALGYLSHLAADIEGDVPWLYPFGDLDLTTPSPGVWEIMQMKLTDPVGIGIELALIAWAAYSLRHAPKSRAIAEGADLRRC
jgi:hypothetical protein